MNPRQSFYRKIAYLSAIGLLLLPLYWLSQPATIRVEGGRTIVGKGGKLAQVRAEYKLSQANLGEIDPTSVTMKLTTLGLHPVAACLLWSTAIDAKDREDWTTFDAALEQIINLQPHFIKVWQFQAHNVSFNISCQFDDYHDRYHYIIKGINLLERGTRYNDLNPRILRELGFFLGFKIGKADEASLYRPMFYHDNDFHNTDRMAGTRYHKTDKDYDLRVINIRDNWQLSKWWYLWVDRLLDENLAPYETLGPAVVHMDSPLAQIQYAKALAEEGRFDKYALEQWTKASNDWAAFGHRGLPTDAGRRVRMEDVQRQRTAVKDLQIEFTNLLAKEPGLRERIEAQHLKLLSEKEKKALAVPEQRRSPEERQLAFEAGQKLLVTIHDLSLGMSAGRRAEAGRLAEQLESAQRREHDIDTYCDEVNFEYWKVRCAMEARGDTLEAHKAVYDGDQAYADANLPRALELYNQGIASWKQAIDGCPQMLDEKSMVEDLMKVIRKYRLVLAQNKRPFPKPFALDIVLARYEKLKKSGQIAVRPDEN